MPKPERCRLCGLVHPPGGPSYTKMWIACREALGNRIVRLTQVALGMSNALHAAEEAGLDLPDNVDEAWFQLTAALEEVKD